MSRTDIITAVTDLLLVAQLLFDEFLELSTSDASKDADVDAVATIIDNIETFQSVVLLTESTSRGSADGESSLVPTTASTDSCCRLVLNSHLQNGMISSGNCFVLNGSFAAEAISCGGGGSRKVLQVKVKLSTNFNSLQREYRILDQLFTEVCCYFVLWF